MTLEADVSIDWQPVTKGQPVDIRRVMEEATGLTMPEHRGREGKVLRVLLSGRWLPRLQG